MKATPSTIQKSEGADRSGTAAANPTPAKIIENPPAKTVAQALANSKAQVDAANQ
jgi:hypothetical protein